MRGQVVADRGEQRAVEVVDRRPAAEEGVVLPHLREPVAGDAPSAGHVLQERHHVLGPLRDPRTRPAARRRTARPRLRSCAHGALRSRAYVHPLPRRAGPPRRPAVQRQRDARAAPDLDRHPRHRAARHGPRSVLRPGRSADRGVHDRQRTDGDRAGPTARPAGPGTRPARGRVGLRGRDRGPRGQPGVGVAEPGGVRGRGAGRRGVPADRLVRAGPLVLRARG